VRRPLLALAAAALLAPASSPAARLKRVGTFNQPVHVTAPPADRHRLLVTERYGRLIMVRGKRRRVWADLRSRVLIRDPRPEEDQRGLLSAAFAPDFGRSGLVYVFYVDRSEHAVVDALRRGATDRRTVADLGPAPRFHHGGLVAFGPDGKLYVSTGVGNDSDSAQDPSHPGGKILRIDPEAAGGLPEVYALGLRNPWRFSFAPGGALLIGDVGEDEREEIDVVPAGAAPGTNFGYPDSPGVGPALDHTHSDGWCAIVGGHVMRDGRYVYGDVCRPGLRTARLRGTALVRDRPLGVQVPYLVSFGQDGRGRTYAVSLQGPVLRIRTG
jgi:glucose/arabinose dehydrogenase